MQAILGAFWQIALLRQGPEDIPDSQLLLIVAAAMYLCVDLLVVVLQYPANIFLPLLLTDIGLLVGWVFVALRLFGYPGRLRQTLTALFGVGAILQLLALPISVLPGLLPWAVRVLLLVLILLWSIAVYGHILGRAISKSFGIGVALSVAYYIVNFEIASRIIPAP